MGVLSMRLRLHLAVMIIGGVIFVTQIDEVLPLQIRPKPCTNAVGAKGTCMFVWECIKTDGKPLGTCVDGFLFGSCCAHNDAINVVPDASVSTIYSRPTTPVPPTTTPKPTPSQPSKPQGPPTGSPSFAVTSVPLTVTVGSSSSLQKPSVIGNKPSTSVGIPAVITPLQKPPTSHWTTIPVTTKPTIIHISTPWVSATTTSATTTATKPTTSFITATNTVQYNKPTFVYTPFRPRPTFKPVMTFIPPTSRPPSFKPPSFKPPSFIPPTIRPSTPSTNNIITSAFFTKPQTTPASTLVNNNKPFSSFSTATLQSVITKKPNSKVDCGVPLVHHPQTKVVGGKNAAFGAWPWQVSVRRTSFFGFSSTHRCGGAILNNEWIATAGHCVDDLLLSQIRIRVGEYDFASVVEPYPHIERGAKQKVVHPQYNFFTYENDLALVRLEEPVEFMPHIAPICLPKEDYNLVGRNATVTGWGRLSEGGVLPSVLQEVQVPIVSNDKCKNMFLAAGRKEYIPDIFMCAGYVEGGRDSCQGDSGGPLQVQGEDGHWFLAGIISWGIGCAEPNLPGVCTRISKFKDWILRNIT